MSFFFRLGGLFRQVCGIDNLDIHALHGLLDACVFALADEMTPLLLHISITFTMLFAKNAKTNGLALRKDTGHFSLRRRRRLQRPHRHSREGLDNGVAEKKSA